MTDQKAQAEPRDTCPRPRRPFTVTLLAIAVLILAGINLIRLVRTVEQWEFLSGLLPFSPLYLVLTGLLWFLIGLPLSMALWRGARWAPWAARRISVAYVLYYWLDRLFLGNNPSRQVNRPFASIISLLALILIYWILSRHKAKAYFGETHEY